MLENGNLAHDVLQGTGVRDESGLCWLSLIINGSTTELMLYESDRVLGCAISFCIVCFISIHR